MTSVSAAQKCGWAPKGYGAKYGGRTEYWLTNECFVEAAGGERRSLGLNAQSDCFAAGASSPCATVGAGAEAVVEAPEQHNVVLEAHIGAPSPAAPTPASAAAETAAASTDSKARGAPRLHDAGGDCTVSDASTFPRRQRRPIP